MSVKDSLDYTFDERVAQQYEGQRAHPAAVADAIGAAIAAVVGPGGRLLELGVGTGRMARPAARAGCQVWGIDLSRQMLEITQAIGLAGIHLCQADMHDLPFADAQFDAALAVHVLHLSQDIGAVLSEAVRTVRPGGHIILGRDWIDPQSVAGRFQQQLRQAVLALRPGMAPPAAGLSAGEQLSTLGAHPLREEVTAQWITSQSAQELLDSIATRTHAESWILTDELLPQVLTRLTAWAQDEWPQLDRQHPIKRRFMLTIHRKHG